MKWPACKCNLQIQYNTKQNPHPVLHAKRKKNPKTQGEPENIVDKQAMLSRKNNAGDVINPISRHNTDPGKKKNMVMAKKQIDVSMTENRSLNHK